MEDEDALPVTYEINVDLHRQEIPIYYQNKELVLLDFETILDINENSTLKEEHVIFEISQPTLDHGETVSLSFNTRSKS
jgi:hypothetical protein